MSMLGCRGQVNSSCAVASLAARVGMSGLGLLRRREKRLTAHLTGDMMMRVGCLTDSLAGLPPHRVEPPSVGRLWFPRNTRRRSRTHGRRLLATAPAGVSGRTVDKTKFLSDHAGNAAKAKLRKGETTIHKEYKALKAQERSVDS